MPFQTRLGQSIAFMALVTFALPSICKGENDQRAGRDTTIQLKPTLQAAIKAFDFGDCDQVIKLLSKTQYIPHVDDEENFVQIYRMLAICHLKTGAKEQAEKEIQNLLILKPKIELDPFTTPPQVIALFNDVRKEMAPKIKEIEAARARLNQTESSQTPNLLKASLKAPSVLSAFVPFGYGQYENGQKGKALAFAISEIALIGINVGSYWWKKSVLLPNTDSLVADQSSLNQYKSAQIIQFTSIGILAATYIYGVVDALINQRSFDFNPIQPS